MGLVIAERLKQAGIVPALAPLRHKERQIVVDPYGAAGNDRLVRVRHSAAVGNIAPLRVHALGAAVIGLPVSFSTRHVPSTSSVPLQRVVYDLRVAGRFD